MPIKVILTVFKMNRLLVSLSLLMGFGIIPNATAEIEFIYTIKEKVFEQLDNTQPTTPFEWNFGAGASGDNLLTAVSFTPPGASSPISIVEDDGEFDFDPDSVSSQAELDAAFPNGSYAISVTDDGSAQDLGPFSITGDSYPIAPYFTNIEELQASDHSQDFIVTWNAFSGANADDLIILEVYDNNNSEEVIFEFLDPSTTSYTIPGGSLTDDNYYDIAIVFANETDGLESPETIIGYLSTTTFYLSTHTSDTTLSFSKWERNLQTAPDTVAADGYQPLILVNGNSNTVTFAQLSGPTGSVALNNNEPNSFIFATGFGTKESLDNAYPPGEYYFGLTENDTFINYGPYDLPAEDSYFDPPLFENFNQLQNFDATQEQTVSWGAAPSETALIQVFVQDESDSQVWSGSGILPGTTSTQIPANTLIQDTNYRLFIRFWNTADSSPRPPTFLNYITATYMFFSTSEDGGVGPIEGVDFLFSLKFQNFEQYGNMPPESPDGWNFSAGVNVDGVTGASISFPGSEGFITLQGEPGAYELDDDINYESQAALNAAFPEGDIILNITNPDETVGPFTITGDTYPNAPHILNAVALQTHDLENADFTLLWNSFEGFTAEDRIVFEMYDDTTGEDVFFEFLDPSLTSFTIPQGTLMQDRIYEIGVLFIKETANPTATPDTLIGYATSTNTEISTFQQTPDPDEIWLSRGVSAEQTSATLPTAEAYTILAEVSGPGFSSATVITPLPSEVNVPAVNPQFAPGEFEFEESFATEGEWNAAYPEGNYSVRIVDNGITTTHGPFLLSQGVLPVVPGITNWDDTQSIDPNQDFQLNWNAFSNAQDVAFIEGELRNNSDPENVLEWDSDKSESGRLISSDFLQPNSTYTGELIFINPDPSITELDSSGVSVTAAYESFTTFTIQTNDGSTLVDYPTWLTQFFSGEQLNNPDIVGQDADPDRDGLSNYFEYLARLNPADRSSKLAYTFTEDPDAILGISPIVGGVIWEVRSSPDLQSWTTVSPELYQVFGNEIQIDLNAFLPSTFFQIVLPSGGF